MIRGFVFLLIVGYDFFCINSVELIIGLVMCWVMKVRVLDKDELRLNLMLFVVMKKMVIFNVFIVGMKGFGVEIGKLFCLWFVL